MYKALLLFCALLLIKAMWWMDRWGRCARSLIHMNLIYGCDPHAGPQVEVPRLLRPALVRRRSAAALHPLQTPVQLATWAHRRAAGHRRLPHSHPTYSVSVERGVASFVKVQGFTSESCTAIMQFSKVKMKKEICRDLLFFFMMGVAWGGERLI